MDALLTFARVEFGVSAGLHFLFVATTLGLAPMLALLSTAHAATGRSHLARATDHVARLYVVGYGLGIVSGIVVEVQLGLNWSGGPSGAYDAIGTALAIETVLAFFVETSLLGLWLASAGRWPAGVRALLLWGVAVAAYASAAIVLAANGSLHRPEGVAADGALVDPVAMLLNPSGVAATWHVAGASAVVGGFWIAAAAAHLMLRRADFEVARTLVRAGVWQVALGAPVAIVAGFAQFAVARVGATEAEEGAWGLLLALMMLVGVLVLGATWLVMVPMLVRTAIARARWLQRCMVALVWVPLATTLMGWVYREEARQPWFVVGVVRTADAASLAPAWALVPGGLVLMAISIAATVLAWVAMHRILAVDRVTPLAVDALGSAVVTIALLAALAAGSVVVEGCVIARCLAGLAPGGARHLTALGAGFLAGELWTIGLLGAAHGLVGPGLHALVPWITVPATVALVGWVVRDAGLWLGPRFGPGAGWRLLVAAGAAVQGCGTALVASAVALAWASGAPPPWSPEAASSPLATAVLHAVLPVALALGVALQLVWLLALRGARIPMLDWTHRERASAQRTTS